MNLIKPIALLAFGGVLLAGCGQKDRAAEEAQLPDPATATETAPPPADPAYSMPNADEPAPASSDTLPNESSPPPDASGSPDTTQQPPPPPNG